MSGVEGVAIVAAIAGVISAYHASVELVRKLPPNIRSKLCCGGEARLPWSAQARLEYWLVEGEKVVTALEEQPIPDIVAADHHRKSLRIVHSVV